MRDTDLIAAVRDLVSMEEAAAFYGLRFNRAGFAVCPFHSEKTGSFKIHNGRGHCFGCGWHGDVIDFVQRLFQVERREALSILIRDFRLPLDPETGGSIRQRQQLWQRTAQLRMEREREAAEREKVESARRAVWDVYILLDRWKRDYAPQNPEDEIDPRYIEACRCLDAAREHTLERG